MSLMSILRARPSSDALRGVEQQQGVYIGQRGSWRQAQELVASGS